MVLVSEVLLFPWSVSNNTLPDVNSMGSYGAFCYMGLFRSLGEGRRCFLLFELGHLASGGGCPKFCA